MNKDLKDMRSESVVFVEEHTKHRVGKVREVAGVGEGIVRATRRHSAGVAVCSFKEAQ